MTVNKFPDQYPAEKVLQAEPVAGDTKDAAIVRPLLRQTELGEAGTTGGSVRFFLKGWVLWGILCKVPLRDVVGLESRACLKLNKRGDKTLVKTGEKTTINSHRASSRASNTRQPKRVFFFIA